MDVVDKLPIAESDTHSTFFRNSFFSALSEFSIVFFFVLNIIAANLLLAEQYGVFCKALALVTFLEIINDCGLRFIYTRDVVRNSSLKKQYLDNILGLQVILGIFCAAIAFGLTYLLPGYGGETRKVVLLLEGATIFRVLKFSVRHTFRAFDLFRFETLSLMFERVSFLVIGFIVLWMGYKVVMFSAAWLVIRSIDFAFIVFLLRRKLFKPSLAFDLELWKRLVREGIPFAIAFIAGVALIKIDTLMLSVLRRDPDEEIGWYNAAYMLINGFVIYSVIFRNSLFPSMSRLHKESSEKALSLYETGVKYLFIGALPLMAIGLFLASDIIGFIYQEHYSESVIALQLLSIILPFHFLSKNGQVVLGAIDKQKVSMHLTLAALGLNVGMNLFAIPRFGYVGAAVTTIISEIVFFALISIYLLRYGYRSRLGKAALKPLVAVAVSAVPIICLRLATVHLHVLLELLIAGTIYLVVISVLGVWGTEEIRMLKQLLGKKSA